MLTTSAQKYFVFAHSAERCEDYLNKLSVKELVSKKRW